MGLQGRKQRVLGKAGLDPDRCARAVSTGPACHLHERCKKPLRGSEIGGVQGGIGVDHLSGEDELQCAPLADEAREAEALEWSEGLIADVADDPR